MYVFVSVTDYFYYNIVNIVFAFILRSTLYVTYLTIVEYIQLMCQCVLPTPCVYVITIGIFNE